MKRRLLTFVIALGAIGLLVGPPAQAATKEGTALIGPDYVSGEGGISKNAFAQACALGQVDGFMSSPFQGLDAYAFDLGSEKMGAFSVKGPGPAPVGPNIPVIDVQLTTYDLDLYFFTSDCDNANETSYGQKCYSTNPTPDEKTSCIKGFKDGSNIRGARYVVVTAALNLGPPIDFVLTHP